MLLSFLFFLCVFLVIGAAAAIRLQPTSSDYLVAGKSLPVSLAALSAVATNNSGYMFIGMIGLTYSTGLSSVWLMVGWIAGDLLGSLLVLGPLRRASGHDAIQSFAGLLSNWWGQRYRQLGALAAIIMIPFLAAYAGAQFSAGGKALQVLFGWNPGTGALIGAGMVLLYSFSGGIRASVWTDAAQSLVMLVAMGLLMVIGYREFAGPGDLLAALESVAPGYMHWFPDGTLLDRCLFVLGWIFGGLGVLGQPHIMIRLMSFAPPDRLWQVRGYYYLWFTLFYGATIVVGLLARVLLPDSGGFDAELALPTLATQLLPGVLVGLVLAALFAATMSTADSLVLSCAASVSRDLGGQRGESLRVSRLATLGVLVIALVIALTDNQTVFQLVLMAWGLLGAAFAPLLIVYSLGARPSQPAAMGMVVTGLAVFLGWRVAGLGSVVYEILPGMVAGLLAYPALKRLGRARAGQASA